MKTPHTNNNLSHARRTLTLSALLVAVLVLLGTDARALDGAYVLRVEAPFTNSAPAWLPLRVEINVADGKLAQAVATVAHYNLTDHPVDVSGLRLAAGRLTGTIAVKLQLDDYQRAKGMTSAVPAQVVAVDVPIGDLTGAAPGLAKWEKDSTLPRPTAGQAAARAWAVVPLSGRPTLYAEFQIMRWDSALPTPSFSSPSGYDGMLAEGALLLRCTIRDGVATDWICLQAPERFSMGTGDQLWTVKDPQVKFVDGKLSGTLNLVSTDDPALRKMASANKKFANLPDQPVPVKFTAQIVGASLSGTAELIHGTPRTSAVIGSVRAWPFARFADREPRTWKFTAEPDPALVQAARAEALQPIRPGEPGKREFWSDAVRFGGFDIFTLDGKKVVTWDNWAEKPARWMIEPLEDYRSRLVARSPQKGISCIAPPTLNLPEVPGAVRYRFSLGKESCELPHPWSAPVELWQRAAPASDWQNLVVQGLDAGGKEVGLALTNRVWRRPSFQGPYFDKPPRNYREAALTSARWMRDNPVNTQGRINTGYGACWYPNGDAQLWYTSYAGVYAGLVLAEFSPDASERAAALDLAVTISDMWLRFFANNYLPDTYKGWAFDQWVYGCSWLDLYRLTGDPRYKEAVLLQARRLTAKQLASGGYGEISPEGTRGASVDPKTGLPMIMSFHWPSMQQWDPSSILYLLGRIRRDLKTDEFRAAEAKTWEWLQQNSIARFDWRRQGPSESSHHKMPWPVMADCALHCYEYLALDLPGAPSEPALMEDLLRWIEDREVDWRRMAHPTEVYPRMNAHMTRDAQARFALACARQARRTGSALWQAKAEALAGTVLISQFPHSGQIPQFPNIGSPWSQGAVGYNGPGSGDGGSRGEYATMALKQLSQLWEP